MNNGTWVDIWRNWIKEATKFNVVSFFDWLSDNYKTPELKDAVDPITQVNRFEVIDHTSEKLGRELVKYGVNIELSFQDDGKTLKVFLTDKAS